MDKEITSRTGGVLFLLPLFTKYWRRLIAGMLCLAGGMVISLYMPMLNRRMFDEALPHRDVYLLLVVGAIIFGLGALELGMSATRQVLLQSIAARVTAELRTGLFRKLSRVPYNATENLAKGNFQDIIVNDVENLRSLYADTVIQYLVQIAGSASALVLMCLLSVPLTVVSIALLLVSVGCTFRVNKRIFVASQAFTESRAKVNISLIESLLSLPMIKTCSVEERESRIFGSVAARLGEADWKRERTTAVAAALLGLLERIAPFVVLLVGTLLIIRGQLMLGALVAFTMYASRVRQTVNGFNMLGWQWQRTKPSLHRVAGIMRMEEEPVGTSIEDVRSGVELRGIRFARGDADIIRNVSLIIPRSMLIAIVGPNGCGKTTLLRIASGLLYPSEGKILIDGVPVEHIGRREYRALCGFVFQNAALMNRTIRETVCFRMNEVWDDCRTYRVLDRVGLGDFVRGLPNKLETTVGEMGSRVSGGEMQRLAIARELAYGPRILFLDEATNSVDASGEAELFKVLKDVAGTTGMSVVFVSHYLSTLQYADLVYAMDRGAILTSGTAAELQKDSTAFKKMFSAQRALHGKETPHLSQRKQTGPRVRFNGM
jgi:ABC-type bacteriocin/lantibiotic exporter with double-glycine peptidase domain